MKKMSILSVIYIMLFSIFTFQKGYTQVSAIPRGCSCIDFKYHCTGKTAHMPGQMREHCSGISVHYNIQFPFTSYCFNYNPCLDRNACLIYKNWHVCSYTNCTANIYQTLPNNPSINGVIIGNWPLVGSTGGNAACVGPEYAGPLNNIHSRTKLHFCPGDEVLLTIPNLEIPDSSGLCLTIKIKKPDGTLLATRVVDESTFTGNPINLTSVFATLSPEIYLIEFHLGCCGESLGCTVNTFKSAFIEIEGEFSYIPYYTVGSLFGSCSPPYSIAATTDPHGHIISSNCANKISFNMSSLFNPNNESVTFKYYDTNCQSNPSNFAVIYPSTSISVGNGFYSTGTLDTPNDGGDECKCYMLELTYDDGCSDDGTKVDRYYFQMGDGCEPGRPFNDSGFQSSELINSNIDIQVMPNPVDNELIIKYNYNDLLIDDTACIITIFDSMGKVVQVSKLNLQPDGLQLQLNLTPGTYHYTIKGNKWNTNGTFIRR